MFKVCCLLFVFPTKTLTHVYLIVRSFFERTLVITRQLWSSRKKLGECVRIPQGILACFRKIHCSFSSTTYSMNPAVI